VPQQASVCLSFKLQHPGPVFPLLRIRVAGTSFSLGAAPGWVVLPLSQASFFDPDGPVLISPVHTMSSVPCSFSCCEFPVPSVSSRDQEKYMADMLSADEWDSCWSQTP
jgi:hypothetical protein